MFIASHLWHPIMKRHLNISMKSIQVLKISCWTNFMASTIPISILYSLFYDSSLTKIFNEVPDVSDPTYLNGCKDSSSSLIITKSVGETQILDSQESKKNLEDKPSDSNIDGKFKSISKQFLFSISLITKKIAKSLECLIPLY